MYGEIKQVIYYTKKVSILVFALLISSCMSFEYVELDEVYCQVNTDSPRCNVRVKKQDE